MKNIYMQIAAQEAQKTGKEIPVGAVIVKNGEIIAKAHNTKEDNNDITAHAEIIALREAAQNTQNWRLDECDMYVTLEPCPMCGWAILQSRIKNLYFGSYDSQYGAFSKCNLDKISESKTKIYGGIEEEKCNEILKVFFQKIR